MTTSAADHAKALRLMQELGATPEQANAVMARFNAAGIHLVSIDPPVEPDTGPKAEEQTPEYIRARRALRNATKPTEYEETP